MLTPTGFVEEPKDLYDFDLSVFPDVLHPLRTSPDFDVIFVSTLPYKDTPITLGLSNSDSEYTGSHALQWVC
jgi:hypothetical protein